MEKLWKLCLSFRGEKQRTDECNDWSLSPANTLKCFISSRFLLFPFSWMFCAEKHKLDRSVVPPSPSMCEHQRRQPVKSFTHQAKRSGPVSHRLTPPSHCSSINLLAVQPSGGHLHAPTCELLPQKVTSWVPCTRAQVWHHSAESHHAKTASIIQTPGTQPWWDKTCPCMHTCCCWTRVLGP